VEDGAGPSGTSSDTVNRFTGASHSQLVQGIVTQNRFACLSQEEIIVDDGAT